MLKEDIIRDEVKKRTPSQKRMINNKRRLAMAISGVIILFGWGLIYAGAIYENDIGDWFNEMTGISFIGDWGATLVMTFVNYFIPWLIAMVDELENWDFASE